MKCASCSLIIALKWFSGLCPLAAFPAEGLALGNRSSGSKGLPLSVCVPVLDTMWEACNVGTVVRPKLEGSPVWNRRRTKHFTISFRYCSLKLCSFHRQSKPQILVEKCIKRLFFQPLSPSTCISIGNAGCLAGLSHGVQQQKDCFPPPLSKIKTFSPGPYWVSFA